MGAFFLPQAQANLGTAGKGEPYALGILARQIVKESLASESPYIRTKAIEVVSDSKQIEFMQEVTALLGDEFVPVRFAAALAVGDVGYPKAANAVKSLLSDNDDNVRIAAAYTMIKLGEDGFLTVINRAVNNTDPTLRANAVMLLGKLGDKNSLKPLYWVMRDADSSDAVRLGAVEAIARCGDEKIYSKIWTMLISTYADDRVMGVRAMSALNTVGAMNALVTLLDDPVVEVRLAAAAELGKVGDKSGQIVVQEYFSQAQPDKIKTARQRQNVLAAAAIGEIGTDSLKGYLPQLLKNEALVVRLAAARAVLRKSDK